MKAFSCYYPKMKVPTDVGNTLCPANKKDSKGKILINVFIK